MRAARIFALARTSRCAIVAAGTRKARAISSTESPQSVFSVRATWASGAGAPRGRRSRDRSVRLRGRHDRPHLDRARAGGRNAGGERDGLVEVLGLNHVEAPELFAGLGEGTVGRQGLAVLHAHGRRRGDRLQRLSRHVVSVLAGPASVVYVLGEDLALLRFGD